jgi:hypothetical protein
MAIKSEGNENELDSVSKPKQYLAQGDNTES